MASRILSLCALAVVALSIVAAPASSAKKSSKKSSTAAAKKPAHKSTISSKPKASKAPQARLAASKTKRRYRYVNHWTEPTYADSTIGDRIDGEDLTVRQAAVEALGPYNGSVIVTDPQSGRILSIVNQKLAMKSGFTPCSTIKLVTSMAGLVEGIIKPETMVKIGTRSRMDLTEALARSNNPYFSVVGRQLGFERVAYYARLFGLGEKAGLDVEGEESGLFPDEEPMQSGGVGIMTAYGNGVTLTPLQLSALLSMIANKGTMLWLQYPRTKTDLDAFTPRIKRQMDLSKIVDQIRPGMEGAVEFGSARRARAAAGDDEDIFGKTGTCTHADQRTHLGWFGSYNQVGDRKLVVVVLLTGGHRVNGPVASGVAGSVYRLLAGQNYYAQTPATFSPSALISMQPCCSSQ